MKKVFSVFFLLLFVCTIVAQESGEEVTVSADRPGMATGVDIMPFKKVQFETGFQWDYANKASSMVLPTAMLRVGVSNFAELRLQYDGTLAESGKNWDYGVEPIVLGTKIRVFEGWKFVPAISFMANLALPSSTELAQTMHVAPSLYLLFQNDVTDWFNVGYNVGVEWNGTDATPATFLAVCLGFGITDNLGAFLESYNYFSRYDLNNGKTAVDANLDFGFNYIVHPRVQLDLYASFNCKNPKLYSTLVLALLG